MLSEAALAEYLDEVRWQACSRCVERPPGGPPCLPCGKECGVEAHLPELIDAIHAPKDGRTQPYLSEILGQVCDHCTLLGSRSCPCPMASLALLIVRAVAAVDRRHAVSEQLPDAVEEFKPEGD
jgi:hypothetical protein